MTTVYGMKDSYRKMLNFYAESHRMQVDGIEYSAIARILNKAKQLEGQFSEMVIFAYAVCEGKLISRGWQKEEAKASAMRQEVAEWCSQLLRIGGFWNKQQYLTQNEFFILMKFIAEFHQIS